MEMGLEGKVVLITGGSKGIGFACARAFAAERAQVAIASRSAGNLEYASQLLTDEGYDVLAIRGDLARPDEAQ